VRPAPGIPRASFVESADRFQQLGCETHRGNAVSCEAMERPVWANWYPVVVGPRVREHDRSIGDHGCFTAVSADAPAQPHLRLRQPIYERATTPYRCVNVSIFRLTISNRAEMVPPLSGPRGHTGLCLFVGQPRRRTRAGSDMRGGLSLQSHLRIICGFTPATGDAAMAHGSGATARLPAMLS